jgi:hypothetical protein
VLTLRNIKQNLVFTFSYNALGVPIAAGTRYPVRPAVESQDRRGGHELDFDFGRRQCVAVQAGAD